jgi:hypothetical protein
VPVLVKPFKTCFSQKLAIEKFSVPDGKFAGGLVLVLLLRASKMLMFSAAPLGPEEALPPQAVRTTAKVVQQINTQSFRLILLRQVLDAE